MKVAPEELVAVIARAAGKLAANFGEEAVLREFPELVAALRAVHEPEPESPYKGSSIGFLAPIKSAAGEGGKIGFLAAV